MYQKYPIYWKERLISDNKRALCDSKVHIQPWYKCKKTKQNLEHVSQQKPRAKFFYLKSQ